MEPMVTGNLQLVQVQDYKKQPRRHRRPKERWNIDYKPYEICPFMLHPVLPGETLDNAFIQSRIVTDKVRNNLIGWWQEKHVFYVPLRALTDPVYGPGFTGEAFSQFFLDPTTDYADLTGGFAGANDPISYAFKGGAEWFFHVYNYVVSTWFRDEDERGDINPTLDRYAAAQCDELRDMWTESLKTETSSTIDEHLPGDEFTEYMIPPEWTTHYAQYQSMRDSGLTDLTYKDFLKSYGITPPSDADSVDSDSSSDTPNIPLLEPERLRVIRNWAYPTLAPQPGDSESSSVLYWTQAEKITKRFIFTEPGFIIGVTLVKPKLYLGRQEGHASGLFTNAYSWLPAVLASLPYTSLQENLDSVTDGILQNQSVDYWLDMKDIFLKGGQFINFTRTAGVNADHHALAIPTATLGKYVTEAQIDSLFSVTDGTKSFVHEDGACHLDILGKLTQTTPR